MFDFRHSIIISVTLLLFVAIGIDGFDIQSLTKIHHKLHVSSLSASSTAIEVDSSKYLDEKQVCCYILYYIHIIIVICFIYICDTYLYLLNIC